MADGLWGALDEPPSKRMPRPWGFDPEVYRGQVLPFTVDEAGNKSVDWERLQAPQRAFEHLLQSSQNPRENGEQQARSGMLLSGIPMTFGIGRAYVGDPSTVGAGGGRLPVWKTEEHYKHFADLFAEMRKSGATLRQIADKAEEHLGKRPSQSWVHELVKLHGAEYTPKGVSGMNDEARNLAINLWKDGVPMARIANELSDKYGLTIHRQHLNKWFREQGMSRPLGRPATE